MFSSLSPVEGLGQTVISLEIFDYANEDLANTQLVRFGALKTRLLEREKLVCLKCGLRM